MSVYSYRAVRTDGQRSKGAIEASSLDEAKRLLREQQFIILHLAEAATKSSKSSIRMSSDDRVIFTSQLAQLLEANVPLYESLQALEEQAAGESYLPVITSLREQIRRGASFSTALNQYPDIFSPLFRAIVVAGESVGRLDQALVRLSQLLTAERLSKQKLISALLYPAILSILLVAALGIMVFFVIPSIEGLFEGRELPLFTRCVLGVTHCIHQNTLLLITAVALAVTGATIYLTRPAVRQHVVARMMHWPVIGPFITKSALARFGRTLSNLLAGGTPLSSALGFAKEALGNAPLEADIDRALREIIEGQTFSGALGHSSAIPPLFVRMVSIGEETGRLAPILANVAQLYEEDSDRLLERAVSLLQPVLLLTMGLIIGGSLLAILLPLANFGAMLTL